jgi:hypothetical protein
MTSFRCTRSRLIVLVLPAVAALALTCEDAALIPAVRSLAAQPPSGSKSAAVDAQQKPVVKAPQYNAAGEFILPADFRTWVFVGANLGIEYADSAAPADKEKAKEKKPKPANFHNVYINPEAYEHYARTGEFPEKTVFILDIYKPEEGEPGGITAHGQFPGKQTEIAAAVKNSARPDGSKTNWAYYDFKLDPSEKRGDKAVSAAKAFPDRACYECHLEHGSDDNVWVQFYPTLRRLHPKK